MYVCTPHPHNGLRIPDDLVIGVNCPTLLALIISKEQVRGVLHSNQGPAGWGALD